MLRRFLHFDSFLTSDLKNRQSYPEDALKINVKHVGFLNQMSEMNQKENYFELKIFSSLPFAG